MSSSILICFAVKEEARFFRPAASTAEIRVLITGMGARNAERALCAELAARPARLVITSGFAGGLAPGLTTGMVLFDGSMDASLEQRLLNAGARRARFHCANRVATTASEKHQLRDATGADAVEMESGHICRLCQGQAIPSATIRAILDIANEDLPLDFNQLMTADLRLDTRKLALAVLRSPGKIGALLRLRRQTETAARSLASALARMLK